MEQRTQRCLDARLASRKLDALHGRPLLRLHNVTARVNSAPSRVGGMVPWINTYEELVTPIINPLHKLGKAASGGQKENRK